jgi:Ala-tRNA(Pro) deacylase
MNTAAGGVVAVLDAAMMENERLNFHPLRNDRTIAVTPAALITFLRACGHEPRVLALPEKTA